MANEVPKKQVIDKPHKAIAIDSVPDSDPEANDDFDIIDDDMSGADHMADLNPQMLLIN